MTDLENFEYKLTMATKKNDNNAHKKTDEKQKTISNLFTSTTLEEPVHQLFGFRQFARNYILGSERILKENKKRGNNTSCSKDTIKKYKITNIKNEKNMNHDSQIVFDDKNIGFNYYQSSNTKTNKLNISAELIDTNFDGRNNVTEKHNVTISEIEIHSDTDSESVYSTISEFFTTRNSSEKYTTIKLKNIPNDIGLDSVVSQIRGGPLRNVSMNISGNSYIATTEVVLEFMNHNDAEEFMKYGATNLFKVNGIHLVPEWCTQKHIEVDQMINNFIPHQLHKESGICRALLLKKYPTKYIFKKHPKSPEVSLVDFDPGLIQDDFNQFGKIQVITPVISRKLCISVIFFDIASAIKAMQNYQDISTNFHKKYYKSWAMWYGTDITDQPCHV